MIVELITTIYMQIVAYMNNFKTQFNQNVYESRLTSFYANDECGTGSCTASGLCENNFEINENGWYTYQGKLVIATASDRLGYTEMQTYNLYDEVTLNIYGTDYQAIVLDVCGACMWDNRVDLFVTNRYSAIDTTIEVIK